MTLNLNLCSPFLSGFSPPGFGKIYETSLSNKTNTLLSLLLSAKKVHVRVRRSRTRASLSESENGVVGDVDILDEELLSRFSGAKDASEVLEMLAEMSKRSGGVVSVNDCRLIINAAIDRGNTDLALSVFYAMRSSFDQGIDFSMFPTCFNHTSMYP